MYILPDKKSIQKPLIPRIDFRNPLTRGLVADFLFSENNANVVNDLAGKANGTFVGSPTWVGTPFGRGLNFTNAGAQAISVISGSQQNNLSFVSIEAIIRPTGFVGAGSTNRLLAKGPASPIRFLVGTSTGGTNASTFESDIGYSVSNQTFQAPANSIVLGNTYHVVYLLDLTVAAGVLGLNAIYVNGLSQTLSVLVGASGTLAADSNDLTLGNNPGAGVRGFGGDVVYTRMWNRLLTPPEIRSLKIDPFQIYEESESLMRTAAKYIIIPPAPLVAAETETPTAQFIIDKIVQGQIGGGSTLSMDVPIPSQDAVLVVTGGSVIATGGSWQSVSFNGVPLTKLVQASVVGADAEIWYMPNPPVGVYPLTIIPTAVTGQVYANAMAILGVDKTDTNIITASTTDAASTSTITNTITPDAPNSLIIDALATLDASSAPVADASQTQVFNPTALNAGERVISTFKISSNVANNTNYNLSVAVNASLVSIALRPAHAPSSWFPNIGLRVIDDVVTSNALDTGLTLSSGRYGYKPLTLYLNSFLQTVARNNILITPLAKTVSFGYKSSNFYLNSFFQTIGRIPESSGAKQFSSTLMTMGIG